MKKTVRKGISLLLCVLMALSCCAVGAGAAEHQHTPVENQLNRKEATCTEDGSYVLQTLCSECDAVLSTETVTIPATGHDYVIDSLVRPSQKADGTWGNGYATYVCKNNSTHIRNAVVARADYTAYDAAVAAINALLNEAAVSDATRQALENILATYAVADNLIVTEQELVNEATANLQDASEKYTQTFTVVFLGKDGETLSEQEIVYSFSAVAPSVPVVDGFVFEGWDKDFSVVTADLTVQALYREGRGYIQTDAAELALTLNETKKVSASLRTDEDADMTLTWSIADSSVAKVDANGNVTGLKSGYTTLTVSALDGEVTATVDVFVYDGQEEYTVQLSTGGIGNFLINGNSLGNAYIKVKSGQSIRFQVVLGSKYDPANVKVTANNKTLTLGADNYFTIPYICEDTTIAISLISIPTVTPDKPETPDEPVPEGDTCWCHSSNSLLRFLWSVLMMLCKLFGVESYQYCACGKAHW